MGGEESNLSKTDEKNLRRVHVGKGPSKKTRRFRLSSLVGHSRVLSIKIDKVEFRKVRHNINGPINREKR